MILYIGSSLVETAYIGSVKILGWPVITLVSGAQYVGSVYQSTSAEQWFADGVSIEGETGSTYVRTIEDEGKSLSQIGSNVINWVSPEYLALTYVDGDDFVANFEYFTDPAGPDDIGYFELGDDFARLSIPDKYIVSETPDIITIETDAI